MMRNCLRAVYIIAFVGIALRDMPPRMVLTESLLSDQAAHGL
jgi:hypothetical protein